MGTAFFFCFGIPIFILGYSDNDKFLSYGGLVVSCFAGCLCLAMTIFIWYRAKRAEKEIVKWLTDEYLFEAYADAYQFEKQWLRGGSYYYKLGINFENNGEKYSRFTSRTEKGRYFKRLNKIVESKRINILYSPKYGEVMVFENKQVQ